ncbi:precorrin-2 C(20)-methyltransferase [Thermanaerosceptrum fracticalcis]|uniref:Precorrin-2 C(20)-methyltransferase n=1 Tax=Thermanaerosceptrum fracticalcis TaxID=1712410 RepID=A0A7G6E0S1_THEFR|nr:precorrin-2 C(20)-methyltransferase [Thermanaerosceptrum fracticalcis]QNB45675.1 precorrin-2 C(20)-methyltransferase [Thermanaerosceptrum fracticalcis]
MLGKFYIMGVGPGDPKLLTIKAYEILQKAAVVAIPYSKQEKDSVAFNIVKEYVPPSCQILSLLMPMTRNQELLKKAWQEAAAQVAAPLKKGLDVVFITIGDPAIYSTGMYIYQELKTLVSELRCETVPGITSFTASAASLNLPLALGTEPLLVVPHVVSKERLKGILAQYPNVVLLKVTANFPEIVTGLEEMGLLNKAVFVSRCGQAGEFISFDLKSLDPRSLDYLSLVIIRKEGVR